MTSSHPTDRTPAEQPETGAQDVRALIVVDVQPTFCEDGALGVVGGNDTAQAIARFAAAERNRYGFVVTTQDWHIEPGAHFATPPAEPDFIDTWPPHGVAGTAEAELHPALAELAPDASVRKGQYAAAYSGFEGTDEEGRTLAELLTERDVTAVDIVGIAESHCVRATALDARALGYPVRVLSDLTVPVTEDQGVAARADMAAAGVEQVRSTDL